MERPGRPNKNEENGLKFNKGSRRRHSRGIDMKRRTFLGGLTAGAMGALFLPQFGGLRNVQAVESTGFAKRCIVFFTPNGTVHQHWRPSGEGTNFSFPAGSILEPLSAFKEDLLVLDGIDFKGVSNHEAGMSAMLTGGGGAGTATAGKSLDQFLADSLGGEDKFSAFTLGVQSDSGWGASNQTRMSYAGPGQFVAPADNPAQVFESMFGDLSLSESAATQLFERRKSVLDLVRVELKIVQNRVGLEERIKLEQHLAALESVESGLQAPSSSCESPGSIFSLDPKLNQNFGAVSKAQIDLMVLAMSCGMTKVASLQCAHTVGPHVFSFLGMSESHHSLSHIDDGNPAGVAQFVEAERFLAGEFAYLLDKLKSLPEPGLEGSMLDHSVVLWAQELGDGRLHDCISVPFVVAGGAGGHLTPGKYLKLGGAPHQKLLVSICHAMGLNNPTFGDPSFGTGPLEGLV